MARSEQLEAILRAQIGWTGFHHSGCALRHRGPARREGYAQLMGAERFGEVRIPLALAAQIDPLGADVPRGLAGSDKAQMSGLLRRVIEETVIMGRECGYSFRQISHGNTDTLSLTRILFDGK